MRIGFRGAPSRLVLLKLKEMTDEVLRECGANLASDIAVAGPSENLLVWLPAIETCARAGACDLRIKGRDLWHTEVKRDYGMWLPPMGLAEGGVV